MKNRFTQFCLLAILAWPLFASVGCSKVRFSAKQGSSAKPNDCTTPDCVKATYTWKESGFGMCSKPCGGGLETQTVTCQRDDGVTVPDSFCGGDKPATSRSCNLDACVGSYDWNEGPFGECSKSCGGGSQSRTVVCQSNNGQSVADSFCSAIPKSATSQTCNNDPCPPGPVTYAWDDSEKFGACSKDCGGGIKTRTVVCRRNDGLIVLDSFCPQPKPSTQESCHTFQCPITYTYEWIYGNWSACPTTCGTPGIRTRDLSCRRSDGQFVIGTLCPQPPPASQETCPITTCPSGTPKTKVQYVTPAQNSVDVVVVVDDSSSMTPDNLKLANRMSGFFGGLDQLNVQYQVCITTTDVGYYKGSPIKWTGLGSFVMNNSTPNKQKIFTDTINTIGSGFSSDEQGIKSMNLMVRDYRSAGCFRQDAALAVILISDEDERSVGGNRALSQVQYKPLEELNKPASFINTVKSSFGQQKALTWNSIIVYDKLCEAEQDKQESPSFFGTLYKQLSDATNGYVGSICSSDYTANLKYIKERVFNSLASIDLECVPLKAPTITLTPNFTSSSTLEGNKLKFSPALPENTRVQVDYLCP